MASAKEAFVVHSREFESHRHLFDFLVTELFALQIAVQDYKDWEWADPGDRVISPTESAVAREKVFEQLPDRIRDQALDRIWDACRVIVIVNPRTAYRLKSGADHELKRLRKYFSSRHRRRVPMVVVADISLGRSRSFRDIPVAGTCELGESDDQAGREKLVALVALAFLVHVIASFRELRDYLLSSNDVFDADVLTLLQASRPGRPGRDDLVGEVRVDEATRPEIDRFDWFWATKGRRIEAWFGGATGDSSLVQAGRILISAVVRWRAALVNLGS
jgi:hypothetical protein